MRYVIYFESEDSRLSYEYYWCTKLDKPLVRYHCHKRGRKGGWQKRQTQLVDSKPTLRAPTIKDVRPHQEGPVKVKRDETNEHLKDILGSINRILSNHGLLAGCLFHHPCRSHDIRSKNPCNACVLSKLIAKANDILLRLRVCS